MLLLIDPAKELLILAVLLRVEQFGCSLGIPIILNVCEVCSILVAPSPLIVITLMMHLLKAPLTILVLFFVMIHLQRKGRI